MSTITHTTTRTFKALTLACLSLLSLVSLACEDVPRKDYEDFKARAEGLRQPPPVLSESSNIADIQGLWFVKANLSAGIPLGLRVRFELPNGGEWPTNEAGALAPTSLNAKIWLERHDPLTEPAILEVSTNVNEEGRFTLVADPLELDPESLGLASAVIAIVNLETQTLNADELCGDATGSVTVPLVLDLAGSTFYAVRDDDLSAVMEGLPSRCPASSGGEGGAEAGGEMGGEMGGEIGGVSGAEMGGEMGGAEVERPESPDLSATTSQLGDLTGHWLVNVQTSVIPLKLWASLIFTPNSSGEGGWIEGSLKRETDPFDAPPLVNFGALVDAEGRFEIWLPNFTLAGAISVEADLLISGLTLPSAVEGEAPSGWCGAGAGQVRSPVMLSLAGSTLYAHPWVPGEPLPEPLLSACPAE